MAGIAGILHLEGPPVDRADLEGMLEVAAYRGPDGRGTWYGDRVAFGHLMLWTTPESLQERLPFFDPAANLAITADARIDNREELIAALGLEARFREALSDSEIILAAYAKWGEECPPRLVGDFAFAVWDGNKRRLFCARDYLGVRPFYYSRQGARFAFASDVAALISLPWVSRKVDEAFVFSYLLSIFLRERTAYQGVKILPPAHVLTCDAAGAPIRRYWEFDPTRRTRLRSDDEYAEAFREVFAEAVRCRLRSAYPVGSMLSGGMDSSSVACVARGLLSETGGRLHTLSGTFPHFPTCDEQRYINTVVAQGGVEAHLVPVDGLSPLQTYLDGVPVAEGPYWGTTFYVTWGLYREAREHGVRVVLDGEGGDDVVSHGYDLLPHLVRTGRWISFLRELRATVPDPRIRRLYLRSTAVGLVPEWAKAARRRLLRLDNTRGLFVGLPPISADFAGRMRLVEQLRARNQARRRHVPPHRAHRMAILAPFTTFVLEALGKVASTFRVQPRFPFYDRRLMEFCVSLPPQQKLRQGMTRWVLHQAMRGVLPETIQQRRDKADLSPCFYHAMFSTDRQQVSDILKASHERLRPYVDLGLLAELERRCFESESSSRTYYHPLWTVTTLAAWLPHAESPSGR